MKRFSTMAFLPAGGKVCAREMMNPGRRARQSVSEASGSPPGEENGNRTLSAEPEPCLGISHRHGRGDWHLGRGDGPLPDDFFGVRADSDRPGGHPADPLSARTRVSLGARGSGPPRLLEPPLLLPGAECGGVLGRAAERRPVVLAVSHAGSVAGPVVRLVDGLDVGAQLCGGPAAVPQGARFRRAGRCGGRGAGGLRLRRG